VAIVLLVVALALSVLLRSGFFSSDD